MNEIDRIAPTDLLRGTLRQVPVAAITVMGDSMSPLLRRGDLIDLKPIELSRIAPGQIITFANPHDPGTLQTHRALAVQNGPAQRPFLLTRGDRVLHFDPLVPADHIIGRVIARQRDGRTLSLEHGPGAWLSSHLGHIAERERLLITGVRLREQLLDPAQRAASDRAAQQRVSAPWARVLRLGSRGWSALLSTFVNFLAALAGPATREL
jgi:hypothetical protein